MNQDFINRKRKWFDKLAEFRYKAGVIDEGFRIVSLEDYTQSLTEAMEYAVREHDAKWHPIRGHSMVNLHGYEQGYIAALDDVEREMPKEDKTSDANEYERADRIGWNAYRTAVLTALSRLRGEKN